MRAVRVLSPPSDMYVDNGQPLVFLAGPIQGAPDWQATAAGLFPKDVVIADPRTRKPWHGDFEGQVRWETRHLAIASRLGCIVFWCAREAEHRCDRAYGQTTRFELGEWFGRLTEANRTDRLIIGIEPGFTNERYICQRIMDAWQGRLQVSVTLEETCRRAAKVLGY